MRERCAAEFQDHTLRVLDLRRRNSKGHWEAAHSGRGSLDRERRQNSFRVGTRRRHQSRWEYRSINKCWIRWIHCQRVVDGFDPEGGLHSLSERVCVGREDVTTCLDCRSASFQERHVSRPTADERRFRLREYLVRECVGDVEADVCVPQYRMWIGQHCLSDSTLLCNVLVSIVFGSNYYVYYLSESMQEHLRMNKVRSSGNRDVPVEAAVSDA